MKTFKINDQLLTVGLDNFTDEDISCFGNEYLDYQIAVMQWYRDGGKIERTDEGSDDWEEISLGAPVWDWYQCRYRVKPKPEYRAYSKVRTEWIGKVIKAKATDCLYLIVGIMPDDNYVMILGSRAVHLDVLFEGYTWEDGSRIGTEL
jgi:hypothetical protein